MTTPRRSTTPTPQSTPAAEIPTGLAKIRLKVFGIGGAGGNAIQQMAGEIKDGAHPLAGVELIAVNTDLQALQAITGAEKLQIGAGVTHGLSAGGDQEIGLRAAQQDAERIENLAQNADIIFILVGLGGGTGTGAAPVVARLAKEQGALVLAIATLPFTFEGERRRQQAAAGLDQLKTQADAVICIPNEKLFKAVGENATVADAFTRVNEWMASGVQAIWQLLARKGLVNLDFADLRSVLGAKHTDGIFSCGTATGADKSRNAVKALMENPLMDGGEMLGRAETVLVSILGGPDMTLADVQRAVEPISRAATRSHVIMGAAIDENHRDRLTITIIATANLMPRRAVQPIAVRQAVGRRATDVNPPRTGAAPPAGSQTTGTVERKPAVVPLGKKDPQPKQESLPLEGITRGRFDKSEPTLYDGEDLDVPTYLRRGVTLSR